jgi:hypothetical protein
MTPRDRNAPTSQDETRSVIDLGHPDVSCLAQILPSRFSLFLTVLLAAMLTACAAPDETSVAPRADTRFLDHLLDTDDARHCDAVGWAVIAQEFAPTPADGVSPTPSAVTPTMTLEYGHTHAACRGGDHGIQLLASCFEPLRDPRLTLAFDPGMMGLVCSLSVRDGTISHVVLEPADFSVVDSAGAPYPMSPAATTEASMAGLTTLHHQALAPGTEARGSLGFALPDDREPPYLLEWTPRVNNAPEEPLWIVLDRFLAIPASLT